MLSSSLSLFAFLTAVSATHIDFVDRAQHAFDAAPYRPSRLAQVARPSRPSESVRVHLVDPASPTTSTVVTPSSIAREALEYLEGSQEEDEFDSSPNFGKSCEFESAFSVCGDYFDRVSQTDLGLFCSPTGTCAGRGAVCGSTEACDSGLVCNLAVHRCVPASASIVKTETGRKSLRQQAARAACPPETKACPVTFGGFECVHTDIEVTQCGGCLGLGGQDCSQIYNSLATSCRSGACQVHACVAGYTPSPNGTECIDEVI